MQCSGVSGASVQIAPRLSSPPLIHGRRERRAALSGARLLYFKSKFERLGVERLRLVDAFRFDFSDVCLAADPAFSLRLRRQQRHRVIR
jgi:hypothetical protein